ncbi:hypothetical_protein [Leishmania infantum]|uniref:Hypothetical_protein n=2 Tax=Leishmania donovani species complex TaxID=38574 RepID=A0A6L0XSE3_LEIIN|nr:hypothetical protein LdCL_360040100 [Leishmania donovani]TPP48440.1 hypothetical protein CGC21_13950 [Leishmania donovani]CAC9551014.1 hypothetical_protein [Leishmania infantum]SUZ46710.1 hypothetical_protein [Leishmania infantum]VDZ49525.1 hypothetical_protein [Leishmania donovani]
MVKVPQQYYDTCAWVRHHYTQAGASVVRTAPSGGSKPSVYTLPMSEPNRDLVLELFPPPAEKTTVAAASSAHSAVQPRRSDAEKETLESRYNRLLLRIIDGIASSHAAD